MRQAENYTFLRILPGAGSRSCFAGASCSADADAVGRGDSGESRETLAQCKAGASVKEDQCQAGARDKEERQGGQVVVVSAYLSLSES